MLRNYIKIAVRNIFRYKGYSFINIAGLAIGMAACIMMMLWVQDELGYDRSYKNADRLYRVSRENRAEGKEYNRATTPSPLASALKEEIPEIVNASRFGGREGARCIKYGDKKYYNDIMALADPAFLTMFDFRFQKGDSLLALNDPFNIIVTKQMARKYFGDDEPLGKVLHISGNDFTISGVIEKVPHNSHLKFDCLASFKSQETGLQNFTANWNVSTYYTYVRLGPDADRSLVEEKMTALYNRHAKRPNPIFLHLQPILEIHLFHDVEDYLDNKGDIKYVYIFSGLALIILVIACINFVNLTIAFSCRRAREIMIRKVSGAGKAAIARQFLGESVIFSLIAFILSLALTELSLPSFNSWSGKSLSLDLLGNWPIFVALFLAVLITGLISGLYPARVISGLVPTGVFRGKMTVSPSGVFIRKGLVIIQFAASIFLIIAVGTIGRQLDYVMTGDPGFDKSNIAYMEMPEKVRNNYEMVGEEIRKIPGISMIGRGTPPLYLANGASDVKIEQRTLSENIKFSAIPADCDYIKTYGMKIIAGNDFRRQSSDNPSAGFIVNETAVRVMEMDSPLGHQLSFKTIGNEMDEYELSGPIIGIVRDFHQESFHNKINPVIIYQNPKEAYEMGIRINADNYASALKAIDSVIDRYAPDSPHGIKFIDESMKDFYGSENKLDTIIRIFAGLAIIVSCLGLLGLASFTTLQRTREFGIRRILGASITGIISLITGEFLILVAFANLLAWPVAYYMMNLWLRNFAYRIEIGIGIFILAGLAALIVALLTVSYQALRAATSNPVKSLKYE